MIDKNTADWRDVLRLKQMLSEGHSINDLDPEAAALSHQKYAPCGGNKGLHDARQKYRRWLKKNAVIEYNKELKANV